MTHNHRNNDNKQYNYSLTLIINLLTNKQMKKSTFFKTLLLAAGLLGGSNAWADVIETVGSSDLTTSYLGASSTPILLKSGGSIHYVFTTATDKGQNWDSWLLVAGGLDAPKRVVRNDNYEIVDNSSSTFINTFNWDTYRADMDGSTVDMTVTYTSGTFAMTSTITTSGGTEYSYSYSGAITNAPTQIPVCLSVEKAYLEITTATYTAPETEPTKTVTLDFATPMTAKAQRFEETLTMSSNRIDDIGTEKMYVLNNPTDVTMELYNYIAVSEGCTPKIRKQTKQNTTGTDGLYAYNTNYKVGVANLNVGDVLTFNFSGTLQFRCNNATMLVDDVATEVTSGGAVVADTEYTITSGTQLDLYFGAGSRSGNHYIPTITITSAYDAVSNPSIAETGTEGTSKIITITAGVSSHSNIVTTYYTTDGTTPSASNYAGYFTATSKEVTISSTSTVQAISISTTAKQSYVVSAEVEAGEKTPLNTPSATITGVAGSAGAYYPVYVFNSDNSDLIGTPEADSYTYTFTPTSGDVEEGVLTDAKYTFTTTGTLEVVANITSDSYENSEAKSITVSENYNRTQYVDVWNLYDVTGLSATKGFYGGLEYDLIANVAFSGNGSTSGAVLRGTHGSTYNSYYGRNAAFTATCSNLTEDMIAVFADKDANDYTAVTSSHTSITVSKDGTLKYYSLYTPSSKTSNVTITSAGWKTLCSPYSLDFTGLGVKAYIVTGTESDGTTLSLTQVNKVPAQTGILLEGEGTYDVPMIDISDATDAVSANKLVGVVTNKTKDAESIYVLMNESNGVGFYQNSNAFTVGANTAYLPADFAAGAKARFFGFGNDATAIKTIAVDAAENVAIYNLSGQRVNAAYKGIVIKNGKKYLNK